MYYKCLDKCSVFKHCIKEKPKNRNSDLNCH